MLTFPTWLICSLSVVWLSRISSAQTTTPTRQSTPRPTRIIPPDAPTRSPTDSPTYSPLFAPCNNMFDGDVIFIVDGSCGLNQTEIIAQQEYISNMMQLIKQSATRPRLGYLDCQSNVSIILSLNDPINNNINESEPTLEQLQNLYTFIKYRINSYSQGVTTPKYQCVQRAMFEFVNGDRRSKTIVIVSNCLKQTQLNTGMSEPIKVIAINMGTNPNLYGITSDTNACLTNKIFSYSMIDTNAFKLYPNIQTTHNIRDEICIPLTINPTASPTGSPTSGPTPYPTPIPTPNPTDSPTISPTSSTIPTPEPTPRMDLNHLCKSYPVMDGWFRFLQHRAVLYFMMNTIENTEIYVEYYFPVYVFTAIAVSNQSISINVNNTGCLSCYNTNNNVMNCLSECIGEDNTFVITGQSDPTHNPVDNWQVWEIQFTDSKNVSDKRQFKIGNRHFGNLDQNIHIELINISNTQWPYVHVSWTRSWYKWNKPKSPNDEFCITIVSSEEGMPSSPDGTGPYIGGPNSYVFKPYTEIHCIDLSDKCVLTEAPTQVPTLEPTDALTAGPTSYPSLAPTEEPLHQFTLFPTKEPSQSTTVQCIDNNILERSHDGMDVIDDTIPHPEAIRYIVETKPICTDSNVTCYVNNGFRSIANCSINNICYIKCDEEECIHSSIDLTVNQDLTKVFIECNGEFACVESTMNVINNNLDILDIDCNGESACESISVDIMNTNVDMVTVRCKIDESCKWLKLNMVDDNFSTLIVDCSVENACLSTNINIRNVKIDHFVIICGYKNSCGSMTITATNVTADTIRLYCYYQYSCDSMVVNMNQLFIRSFDIYCIHSLACNSINIITAEQSVTDINEHGNIKIGCYSDNSCNGMQINMNKHMFFNMIIYKYSNDIHVIHPVIDKVNVTCWNSKNKMYIQYNTDIFMNERELIDLARHEFHSNYLPCEGIFIDCTTNDSIPQFCNMEYQLNPLNLSKYIQTRNDVECYWLELADTFNVNCNGICGNLTYFYYNQSIDLNIIFIDENNNISYKTEIMELCYEYFGTSNKTEATLSIIDAIFERALSMVEIYDPFAINNILKPPSSVLRDGLSSINCSNDTFSILEITTDISVQSAFTTKKKLIASFHENSTFVIESKSILTDLFQIPINIQRIVEYTETITETKFEYVWEVTAGSIIFVCSVICIVSIGRRMKQLRTIYIEFPMVIAVSIGEYDKNPINSQFDYNIEFPDLTAIDCDIKNLISLFGEMLYYEIFPQHNSNSDIKIHWTKNEIMTLLTEKAKYLDRNKHRYDGLVVIISCHGVEDNIATSDYKKINKTSIHRIFSDNYPSLRDIPHVFIYDCCAGDNDKIRNTTRDDNAGMNGSSHGFRSKTFDIDFDENVKPKPSVKDIFNQNIDENESSEDDIISTERTWYEGEANPDYKLVIINASNKGFKSQMGDKNGSFMIRRFVSKMKENLKNENDLRLFEVMQVVQEELHDKGFQLMEAKYNNKTEYIKFRRNGRIRIDYDKDVNIIYEDESVSNEESKEIEMNVMKSSEEIHIENNANDKNNGRVVTNLYAIIEEDVDDVDNIHFDDDENQPLYTT